MKFVPRSSLTVLPRVLLHYVLQIIIIISVDIGPLNGRVGRSILYAISLLCLRRGVFKIKIIQPRQSDPIHAGHVTSFPAALSLISLALAARGFHNAGVVPNAAVDIAPRHSGTVFGLVNTLGSVSGSRSNSSSSSRELIARMNSKLINSHSTSCGYKAHAHDK